MKRILLAAAAALSFATSAQASVTIEGGATGITLNDSDPGLVVWANPVPFGPFTLDLDPSTATPAWSVVHLLTIGTDETTVNLLENWQLEDVVPHPISIAFSFSTPSGVTGDPVTGETFGVWLIDIGKVDWGGPVVFDFGTGGSFSLELFDTHFGTPGSAEVYGKFKLLENSAVPEPGTWAMMLLGFGAAGYSLRRRRAAGLAQLA